MNPNLPAACRSPCPRNAKDSATLLIIALARFILAPSVLTAREHDREQEVTFSCPVATAVGTLVVPHQHNLSAKQWSCVVILGGTLSHTRDGAMEREGVPPRDALIP